MRAFLLAALVAGGALSAPPARAADDGGSPLSWEAYRIRARQDLDVIGDKLAALEMEARVENKRASEDLLRRTEDLRAKRAEADRLLGQFESASGDPRRQLRARLDAALSELKKGVEKAEAAHRDWSSSRPQPAASGLG